MENNYLRNEIDQLERFVTEKTYFKSGITEEEYLRNIKIIDEECSRIKESIWTTIFNLGLDHSRISSFIDYHLNKIIDLSEASYTISKEVSMEIASKSEEANLLNVYALLLDRLNDLLEYFKAKFRQHFNNTLKPPTAYIKMVTSQCETEAKHIISTLKKHKVSPEMINVLQDYFSDPLSLNCGNDLLADGFHRLEFFQTMVADLSITTKDNDVKKIEEKIFIELMYLNFNLLDYIWFSIKQLKPKYEKLTDLDHEISILTMKRNEIMQYPVKYNYGYEPDAPTLKSLIVEMLKEEIKFLKKQIEHEREYRPVNPETNSNGSYFFEVTFTLKELLFFFRLLVETGYLIIKNRTGIFNFISKHIQTKKHSQLSVGSMKRKFNHTDQKGIKNIRTAMLAMIRLINEKYLFISMSYCIINEAFYFPQIL